MQRKGIGGTIYKLFILLFYRNDTQLLAYPGKKDRDRFIWQAVFGTMAVSLFTGVFLTGLYIYMGASDTILAYIPIMPSIAGIFLIFMGSLTEKVNNTKRTVIILNTIAKTLIFGAVWVPLLVSREIAPFIMLPFTFFGFTINSVMSVLVNSWFVDTVDQKIRGRYMGVRQIFALVVSATLPVISGNFLDSSPDRYVAFCIIYSAAWLFSMLESVVFVKITEPQEHDAKAKKIKISDLFILPLRNKAFRSFILLQIVFHTFWYLSMTVAQVYEIRYMQVSYTYLTAMGAMGAVIQMLLYPLWGKVMDKYGSNLVMRITMVFYTIHAMLYFFMIKGNAHFLILLLNINGAILSPAWVLSTFNERFSVIPRERRRLYDGFFTTVMAVVILLAPTIGNIIRELVLKSGLDFLPYIEFKSLFFVTFATLLGMNLVLLFRSRKRTGLEKEKELLEGMKGVFRKKYRKY